MNCFLHICGLYSVGVNVQQHLWLWERPLPGGSNTQGQRAASEQDLKRRYILDSIRLRTLERGGLSPVTAASLPNQEFSQSVLNFHLLITQSANSKKKCNSKGAGSDFPSKNAVKAVTFLVNGHTAHQLNTVIVSFNQSKDNEFIAFSQSPSSSFPPQSCSMFHFPKSFVSQPNFHFVPSSRLQQTAELWVTAGVSSPSHKPTWNGSRS